MTIPETLSAFAADLPADGRWTALSGGRTNRVWRVEAGDEALVCKLYRGRDDNPMFGNDPEAEFACLSALTGQDIAPDPVRMLEHDAGTVLLYRYLDGQVWRGDVRPVAQLLKRVHELPPPRGLRRAPVGDFAVLAQGDAILVGVAGGAARQLRSLRPEAQAPLPAALSFLHGDVVPANLLQTRDGLRLIDWQCPALGDPVDDLACFLSPAMQVVYGDGPLEPDRTDALLAAYGDPLVAARYRALRRAYHYRMAAYCLWRVEHGNSDYHHAFEAELAALGHL